MHTGTADWSIEYEPASDSDESAASRYGLILPSIGADSEMWPGFRSDNGDYSGDAHGIFGALGEPEREGRNRLDGGLLEFIDPDAAEGDGSAVDSAVQGDAEDEWQLPWKWRADPLDVPPWLRPEPGEMPPLPPDLSDEDRETYELGMKLLAELAASEGG